MNNINTNLKESIHWKKNVILFLISQSISLLGSSIVQYAIIWHITLTTASGVMMTVATLCGFLPQIFISIFAGVWADRHNKKILIIISDICIAISTFILAIFFLIGFNGIWILFIGLALRSLGSGVQTPAVNSFIPELVPENHLMRVNAINSTMQSIMLIASPLIAGSFIGYLPIGSIFFIDVATAFIGVSIFSTIKIVYYKQEKKKEKLHYFSDFKEGLIYIKQNLFVRTYLIFFSFLHILFGPMAFLTPLLVTRSFGNEVWRLTANEVVFFIGTILGGALMATWGGFKNKIYTVCFSCAIFAICSISMGLPVSFIVYLIFIGFCGIGMSFMQTPSMVILQESVTSNMQGRIFSIVQILASGIMPLSMLLYGPLADKFSIELLLIITGIACALLTGFMVTNKTLINGMRRLQKEDIIQEVLTEKKDF